MTRLYFVGLALLVGAVGYGIGFQVGTSHQIGAFRSYLGREDVVLDAVGERMREILLWPDPLERAEALGRVFKTLEPDALESVKQAYGTVSFDYGDVELQLLAAWWAGFDAPGAWDWTRQNWIAESPAVVYAVLRAWAREDPQAALAAILRLRSPGLARPYRESLIIGWDESGQPGLVDYVRSIPGIEDRQPALGVLARRRVLRYGPEAAFEWAEGLAEKGDERFKLNLYRRVVTAAGRVDPRATAAFVSRHAGTRYGDGLARRLGVLWVETDGESAMRWLSTLPESRDRQAAVGESYRMWLRYHRKEAWEWIRKVPVEPWLDAAVSMYARSLAATDPEEGLRWSARVQDESLRQADVILILRVWVAADPERARAYMDEAGVSEYVRTKVAQDPRARKRRAAAAETQDAASSDPAGEAPDDEAPGEDSLAEG